MESTDIQMPFNPGNPPSDKFSDNRGNLVTSSDRIFAEWCFWRETQKLTTYVVLLVPVLSTAFLLWCVLRVPASGQGTEGALTLGILFLQPW